MHHPLVKNIQQLFEGIGIFGIVLLIAAIWMTAKSFGHETKEHRALWRAGAVFAWGLILFLYNAAGIWGLLLIGIIVFVIWSVTDEARIKKETEQTKTKEQD